MSWFYRLLHRRALRRGRALDRAHRAPNGDRIPLADLWQDWR